MTKHLGYGGTRRALGKRRRSPDSLRLAEPFLATEDFQNNVMININEVFGFWVTYLGIWAIAAQSRILGGVRTLYLWYEE